MNEYIFCIKKREINVTEFHQLTPSVELLNGMVNHHVEMQHVIKEEKKRKKRDPITRRIRFISPLFQSSDVRHVSIMSLFRALNIKKKGLTFPTEIPSCSIDCSSLEKPRSRSQSRHRTEHLSGVQQWPYYHDLAIQSGISFSSNPACIYLACRSLHNSIGISISSSFSSSTFTLQSCLHTQ